MTAQSDSKVSIFYLSVVLLLMLVFPLISIAIDYKHGGVLILLIGKWFVFWAIGIRLFTAGLRQAINPAFTARDIFHIDNVESYAILRELGFANICFGLIGILSIFIPPWRSAAAFAGGLYMGIAGVQHIIKKPASPNEVIAMVSDIFIFLVLAAYMYGDIAK